MRRNQKFAREFARLNPQQKEAVETIEGPVMVLAGPGTGKTQIVAMRIAQILAKTQANPRNILALTFTEAGVTALRERLISIIGSDAYQVTVATFHQFANEIIGAFPYAFELPATTANLDELEQYQIFDRIIKDAPKLELLRPARVPTFHVPAVLSAVKSLKQENISPQDLRDLVSAQLKSQPAAATKIQVETLQRQTKILKELSDIYVEYQEYLTNHQLYDYEDMIIFILKAMVSNVEIKQYLQERYQYILVDEYQDTNNAQNALVEALADFFETPNLFVVGDDKQAIYRFQGASVANMLHFTKTYQNVKLIVLKSNYRNPQLVINAATELIGNNKQQLNAYLKIEGQPKAISKSQQQARLVTLPTKDAQYWWIVNQLKARQRLGVARENMAVLFRTNREVQEFRVVAESFDLPVAGLQSVNLLYEPEITGVLAILRAVAKPTESQSLLAALPYLHPLVTAVEVAIVLKGTPKDERLLVALCRQKKESAVASAARSLRSLNVAAKSQSLLELIYEVLENCHLTSDQELAGQIDRLEIVHAFLSKVEQLAARNPGLTITELLEYFELLRTYKITLPVKRASPEKSGVFAATVHGAKGLEFEVVFMANASAESWKVRPHNSVIKLPSQIANLKNWREDQLEDERRLFFVGMTRARTELIFTLGRCRDDGSKTLPCQFITEIDNLLIKEEAVLSQKESSLVLSTLLRPAATQVLTQKQTSYIREQISNSPFSYTHLRAYLTCPRQYLLRHVLKLPEEPNFLLIYGSAVHKAFELYFKKYNQTKEKPPKDVLVKYFHDTITHSLEGDLLRQTITRGTQLLSSYYDRKSADWVLPVGVEYSFYSHHVLLDDVWLTGKFDRIDPIDPVARTVRIVDYKTSSRAKTRGQIEGTTKDSEGEIKQQLVFYALLTRRDRVFPYHAQQFVVSSIDDAGKFSDETFLISNAEITKLEEKVKQTYGEIKARTDFPHTRADFDKGCELCARF